MQIFWRDQRNGAEELRREFTEGVMYNPLKCVCSGGSVCKSSGGIREMRGGSGWRRWTSQHILLSMQSFIE